MFFSNQKVFEEEIKPGLDEGKGCVVLDLACRFPYANQDVLTFGFNIDSDIIKDYKVNHRYPNKSYVTVSKQLGRSLSKCGYPCFVEIPDDPEANVLMLNIGIGINDEIMTIILPVCVTITKDKPVCGLSVVIDFDTMHLNIRTYAADDDGSGYTEFRVTNYELEDMDPEDYVLLGAATKVAENCVAFSDAVAPIPCILEKLMV